MQHNLWENKEAREWRENQDTAISEYPDYHSRYLENRGKATQSKASAVVNAQGGGGENKDSLFLSLFYSYVVVASFIVSIRSNYSYGFFDLIESLAKPFELFMNNSPHAVGHSIIFAVLIIPVLIINCKEKYQWVVGFLLWVFVVFPVARFYVF